MEFMPIPVDAAMAEVIMGGLNVSYLEKVSGVKNDAMQIEDCIKAEDRLVRCLYGVYPDVVKKYDWLESVKKAINE